jgi:hypothetical protein
MELVYTKLDTVYENRRGIDGAQSTDGGSTIGYDTVFQPITGRGT